MLARFSSLPCLLAFISVASALESPLPNHDVQQQVWTVPITPGGPKVMVEGTVQQFLAQVTEINPNYEGDFPSQALDPSQRRTDIDKRDYKDHLIGRYSCGYDFYGVVLGRVLDEKVRGGLVDYLDKVTGTPKLGPVSCSRVSCDSGQGIWWCNHVSFLLRNIHSVFWLASPGL